MKANNKYFLFTFILLLVTSSFFAQEEIYSCKNSAYGYLETLIGTWEVMTKDRISPEVYENNSGVSKITTLINGCSVKESFRGTYKNKNYAREVIITGKDSIGIQMSVLDSEHNKFSILNGNLENNQIIVYWFQNEETKKLQSKYILTIYTTDKFEFSSYLSTDYGENWALTHQRVYTKKE